MMLSGKNSFLQHGASAPHGRLRPPAAIIRPANEYYARVYEYIPDGDVLPNEAIAQAALDFHCPGGFLFCWVMLLET